MHALTRKQTPTKPQYYIRSASIAHTNGTRIYRMITNTSPAVTCVRARLLMMCYWSILPARAHTIAHTRELCCVFAYTLPQLY